MFVDIVMLTFSVHLHVCFFAVLFNILIHFLHLCVVVPFVIQMLQLSLKSEALPSSVRLDI